MCIRDRREGLQLGHTYIGTEHILLGLIREGEGVAAQVLVKLGADLNKVRQQVSQLLAGYQSGQGEKAGAGAVSYTHLDVYKRQALDRAPVEQVRGTVAEVAADRLTPEDRLSRRAFRVVCRASEQPVNAVPGGVEVDGQLGMGRLVLQELSLIHI